MEHIISRRSLLTTAGVVVGTMAITGLAACSANPLVPEPTASPTGPIRDQLDQAMKTISGGRETFGVAITDLRSPASYSFRGDYASQSASMAKPMIVAMALRKAGGLLDAEKAEWARKAITESNNDAASALWTYAGYDGYTSLAADLDMTSTHLDANKTDQWSWTWTTPADQLKLVAALSSAKTKALTAEQCHFLWDLMGQVVPDQTWGIGAPKSAEVGVHLKNGWVQFKSTDNLWAVNSMGQVDLKGAGLYQACVMTRVPDFATGRELTSTVGKWAFNILSAAPLAG